MPLLLLGLAIVAVVGIARASQSRPSTQDDDTLIDQNDVTWDLQTSKEPIPGGKPQYSGVPRGTVYPVEARFMFRDTMGTVRAEILAYAAKWAIDHPKTPGGGGVPPEQPMGTYTDVNAVRWTITFTPSVLPGLVKPWQGIAGGTGIYAGTMLTDTSDALLKKKIDALATAAKNYGGAPSSSSLVPATPLPPIPPAFAAGCKNYDSKFPLWGTLLAKTGPDLYRLEPFASFASEQGIVIAQKSGYLTGAWNTGGVAYGKVVEVVAVTKYASDPVDLSDQCILFDLPKEG